MLDKKGLQLLVCDALLDSEASFFDFVPQNGHQFSGGEVDKEVALGSDGGR